VRDEDTLEMLNIILDNRRYDLSYYYNWGDIRDILLNVSSSGSPGTVVSQFERYEPRINAAIRGTLDELEIN
jgi:hypothetical protein